MDNIQLCKVCNGWGELSGHEGMKCKECQGTGASFLFEGKEYRNSIPSYIDYKSRLKIKFFRKIFVFTFFVFSFLLILILLFMTLSK